MANPPSRVAILRNPTSGTGLQRGEILDLISHLRQHGFRPRLFSRRERLNSWIERPENGDNLRCIVAAGGDGTINDVLNRYPGIRIAVLPLGTENLLARYLGIPRSGRRVAEMIAQGETRRLDLGSLNGRRFLIMASVGFDADVVHRTHARRSGHITKLNYLQPIVESLRKYKYPSMKLYLNGSERPLRARSAVLVNLPAYAFHLPVAESARGDDGLLDIRLFQPRSAFQMLRYLFNVALGRHEELDDVQSVQAARVRVESRVPVPIQVDGDPGGWTPTEVCVIPSAFEVFVPSPETPGEENSPGA